MRRSVPPHGRRPQASGRRMPASLLFRNFLFDSLLNFQYIAVCGDASTDASVDGSIAQMLPYTWDCPAQADGPGGIAQGPIRSLCGPPREEPGRAPLLVAVAAPRASNCAPSAKCSSESFGVKCRACWYLRIAASRSLGLEISWAVNSPPVRTSPPGKIISARLSG